MAARLGTLKTTTMAMAAMAAAVMAAMVSQQRAPRRTYRMTGTGRSGWGRSAWLGMAGQLGMAQTLSGWWFGTFFPIYIYFGNNYNTPNWRTHIFQRGRYTTNQLWFSVWKHIQRQLFWPRWQAWTFQLTRFGFGVRPSFRMFTRNHLIFEYIW